MESRPTAGKALPIPGPWEGGKLGKPLYENRWGTIGVQSYFTLIRVVYAKGMVRSSLKKKWLKGGERPCRVVKL